MNFSKNIFLDKNSTKEIEEETTSTEKTTFKRIEGLQVRTINHDF